MRVNVYVCMCVCLCICVCMYVCMYMCIYEVSVAHVQFASHRHKYQYVLWHIQRVSRSCCWHHMKKISVCMCTCMKRPWIMCSGSKSNEQKHEYACMRRVCMCQEQVGFAAFGISIMFEKMHVLLLRECMNRWCRVSFVRCRHHINEQQEHLVLCYVMMHE